jgi:hypothetical protein
VKVLESTGLIPFQGSTAADRPREVRGWSRSYDKDAGIHPVAVGELHLNAHWGGLFEYTNTRTTSFQAGVSHDGKH